MLPGTINNPVANQTIGNNAIPDIKVWIPPIVVAISIIIAGIVIQRVVRIYLNGVVKRKSWKGGKVLITSFRGMIILVSILFGVYFGMTVAPIDKNTILIAHRIHIILVVFIFTFVIARVLTGLMKAYSHGESAKSSLSLFKSIINIIVYTLGLLVLLESFGVSITPMLTALGVGGLAVALALQDTLSNLFSGIQLTLTRTIKAGDYIHLTSGEEGTVMDINWRATTLLTQSENVVVIPNSTLATTIITNYSLPKRNLSITVPMGVAYDSDLEKVERVTLEIGGQLMKEYGILTKPVFRYKEFGNSSINLSLSMDVNEFSQQYILRHEFIKRIYKRFQSEGIEIPFPATTVYMRKEGEN